MTGVYKCNGMLQNGELFAAYSEAFIGGTSKTMLMGPNHLRLSYTQILTIPECILSWYKKTLEKMAIFFHVT